MGSVEACDYNLAYFIKVDFCPLLIIIDIYIISMLFHAHKLLLWVPQPASPCAATMVHRLVPCISGTRQCVCPVLARSDKRVTKCGFAHPQ